MDRWQGKVAVVTGTSTGIGLAIVRELVKHNITTIALSRRPQLVDDIKPELEASEAAILHSRKCDISQELEVEATFDWIDKEFKAVHILINNAGMIAGGTLIDGPTQNWRKTLDTNVLGTCLTTKAAFTLMNKTGVDDGHIIHINSVGGHKVPNIVSLGLPVEFNVYPATKFAITALAETLRMEIYHKKLKTKVTSLSPGLVKTDIFKANGTDSGLDFFSVAPYIEAKYVAEAAMYILSTPPHVSIPELTIQPLGEII